MDLEDILAREGIASFEVIHAASDRATRESRPLVAVLVEEGAVSEDALADAVAQAVGTIVIDMEQGELDGESVGLLSETLARGYLMIPVAPDPSGKLLRVAFANPLDEAAVHVVQDVTGLSVQPLVGTVSGILAAIERAYAGRDTRVVRTRPPPAGRSEMPAEVTQRVDARRTEPVEGTGGPSTSPLHRLEHEAPIEQRFEALLLALIERGALTRADYIEALRRLMRR